MHITSRSEYGLRAMILLAEQLGDELLSASCIAERTQAPRKYLEQILSDLKRAELVVSRAGARGGYRLARDPRQITAVDIVQAVDGPILPLHAGWDQHRPPTQVAAGDNMRPMWNRLDRAIRHVLGGVNLEQLAFNPGLPERIPDPARVELDDEDAPQGPSYFI